MVAARKPKASGRRANSLWKSLGEFLTPEVWKQARRAAPARKRPRWDVHPLLFVLLTMTWCCGDSLPERFEAARAFYVACHAKRRRPGDNFQGFQQALAKLPMPVLRALARGVRGRIQQLLTSPWRIGAFVPLGCDGSRLECPRTEELMRRLGPGGKAGSAPTVWVTAVVHLFTGVPWTWRLGKGGKASERQHLLQMLADLPACALLVADAGYFGYGLVGALMAAKVSFLLRMSSTVTLYTDRRVRLQEFREGLVYYWTDEAKKKGLPPLPVRLLRVRSRKRKVDVWLLTNGLSAERLSLAEAGRFYRWRWENEGYFRTYKRTLGKLKLWSRTVRTVHREAEGSMIAAQLLLAQGARAIGAPHLPLPAAGEEEPAADPRRMCSPRKVLQEFRREIQACWRPRRRGTFAARMADCLRERRPRTSPKAVREWPRRKEHKPPGAPKILKLPAAAKGLISQGQEAS